MSPAGSFLCHLSRQVSNASFSQTLLSFCYFKFCVHTFVVVAMSFDKFWFPNFICISANNMRYDVRDDVGVVTFDVPNSKVNTLTADYQAEFAQILEQIKNDDRVKSVVLISGKPDCFIAGADIGWGEWGYLYSILHSLQGLRMSRQIYMCTVMHIFFFQYAAICHQCSGASYNLE